MSARAVTVISSKGQVVLPKALRDRRNWPSGTRLTVEETPDGLLLRPARLFPETTLDEVAGMLKWDGPPLSIEEMDAAVLEGVAEDYAKSVARD